MNPRTQATSGMQASQFWSCSMTPALQCNIIAVSLARCQAVQLQEQRLSAQSYYNAQLHLCLCVQQQLCLSNMKQFFRCTEVQFLMLIVFHNSHLAQLHVNSQACNCYTSMYLYMPIFFVTSITYQCMYF